MYDFWIASAALVAVAALFVLYPLWRKAPETDTADSLAERRHQNIVVYKDRLKELEQEKTDGALSDADFERLKSELEASLLNDVGDMADTANTTPSHSLSVKMAAVVSIVLIPVIAYGLYAKWGALDKVESFRDWQATVPEVTNGMPQQDIGNLLKNLRQKLEADPENIDGWFLLARTAMNIEEYPLAASAFLRMADLLEGNGEDAAAALGLAAQAQFFEAGGRLTPAVQATVDKALSINENETNALGLLGINAFETGQFADAVKYWSKILEVEPDIPSREAIQTGIARAQQQLGTSPVSASDVNDTEIPRGAGVLVEVSLADHLKSQVQASDAVFIYAVPADGSRMPLAASRQRVSDLPLKLELNDAMAMGPMAKISSHKEVTLIARVSKSGLPTPQSGDMEIMLTPVKVGASNPVTLEISTVLP